jgi:hypothetical protein
MEVLSFFLRKSRRMDRSAPDSWERAGHCIIDGVTSSRTSMHSRDCVGYIVQPSRRSDSCSSPSSPSKQRPTDV